MLIKIQETVDDLMGKKWAKIKLLAETHFEELFYFWKILVQKSTFKK